MKQPDIEIYLKNIELTTITQWLQNCLGECSAWQLKGNTYQCYTQERQIPISFYPKAVGNWHCLYFASNATPWPDDLACAKAANRHLNIEVRCAPNGWTEEIDESVEQADRWLSVNQQQITEITWKTH